MRKITCHLDMHSWPDLRRRTRNRSLKHNEAQVQRMIWNDTEEIMQDGERTKHF